LLVEKVADGTARPSGWVEAVINGTRIASLDERAALIVGAPIPREEMIGRSVASFAPPFSWQALAEMIVAVASDVPRHTEQSTPIRSYMLRDAHLKVWAAESEATSTRVYAAVIGVISDDRSLWAVRASEQRYQTLIQHLPIALLQVDGSHLDRVFHKLRDEGVMDLEPCLQEHVDLIKEALKSVRVTDANEAAVKLFGAANAEELLRPVDYIHKLSSGESSMRTVLARFRGERHYSQLIKLQTLDGRVLDVQFNITFPNAPERLDVALLALEDVTERLRTEAQLRQVQAEHSRATRIATLGELASSIAHEVNQPLTAIAMNAKTSLRWLLREDPNLPKVAQLTERIEASAHHASEIVQRIRNMAARHPPERLSVDLNEVVTEALLFVRHDLDTKRIRLKTEFSAEPLRICGDRVQLQQVIVNLLVNSIQAQTQQEASGGLIELRTGLEDDGAIFFAVHDGGPGIAPENLDRIFDGFFTTKDDGMGIGLSVCQSIIVAHGGNITADNHTEGGAVFRVTLPLDPDPCV
jgi:C4-dicarboxylate-specific signal transduction histidine kinase